MSSVGSARQPHGDGGRWWQNAHERVHERRDHELDRRYHALADRVDHRHDGLEERLRKVERAIYVLTGVLSATTITAVFNLIVNLTVAP